MKSKDFLTKERKLTDDSLNAERDKTNESISKARVHAENEIDESVSRDRIAADQVAAESRTQADSKVQNRNAASGKEIEAEKKNGDSRIIAERKRSDNAVELERSKVDAALEKEREMKSILASKLLKQERMLTDKNLSYERDETDSEVQRRSSQLLKEISEHTKTKVSLTTRDEFLAIVSHDLRNPIGAASSCAEMLLEDSTFKNIDPGVKHWIEFIKRNVDVSLRMIADLLDMERIASDKLRLKLEKHSIGQIIRHSVEGISLRASAKGILLRAIPIVGFDQVVCDHDRILQVLSNLIGNAVKFTPEGGSITITTSLNDREVSVSIKDTGPGIPEDKQGQIFERFAQLGSSDRSGLGLGLYISKMLIEAHGGQISMQSKVNEGTTFTFTIPVVDFSILNQKKI